MMHRDATNARKCNSPCISSFQSFLVLKKTTCYKQKAKGLPQHRFACFWNMKYQAFFYCSASLKAPGNTDSVSSHLFQKQEIITMSWAQGHTTCYSKCQEHNPNTATPTPPKSLLWLNDLQSSQPLSLSTCSTAIYHLQELNMWPY